MTKDPGPATTLKEQMSKAKAATTNVHGAAIAILSPHQKDCVSLMDLEPISRV